MYYTIRKFFLSLSRRRITGNAEVRPANVSATPSADGRESDVKYLPPISFALLYVQLIQTIYHTADYFTKTTERDRTIYHIIHAIDMAYEKLQLISVRLDPKIVRKLDELAAKHDYYKRSSIINNLLNSVLFCASPGTLWKMYSTYSPESCGYTVDFHVDKEKLANLPKE